jgi:hypothetical protein
LLTSVFVEPLANGTHSKLRPATDGSASRSVPAPMNSSKRSFIRSGGCLRPLRNPERTSGPTY